MTSQMTQNISKPAKRNHKDKIRKVIKNQSWVLFVAVLVMIMLDMLVLKTNLVWSRSFVSGAVLSFISQCVLAWFSFRQSGYKARRHVVNQLYLGVACRWLVNLFGFVIIFVSIKPINAFIVLFGFILIQMSYLFMLWRVK